MMFIFKAISPEELNMNHYYDKKHFAACSLHGAETNALKTSTFLVPCTDCNPYCNALHSIEIKTEREKKKETENKIPRKNRQRIVSGSADIISV